MSYMSLLIRERADLRDTKQDWRQDIALADQWLQRREAQKAGGGLGFSPPEGLPQYGVTLSGSPADPVVENHSGRVVISYDIKFADSSGPASRLNQILAPSLLPAGIPDGGSVYAMGNAPVSPPFQRSGTNDLGGAGSLLERFSEA
jgi:hypothetical protein